MTGKIWLVGVEKPVELKLEGNCHRDMAGHLLTFENPNPVKPDDEHTDLNPRQDGLVGDLTASRKVRVFDIPLEEALAMYKQKEKPPEHLANCLYLEWYSDFNGRVVIESTDYRTSISEPAWRMTEEEEVTQLKANGEAIVKWMERLTGAVSAAQRREEIEAAEDKDWSEGPMDEFEWEKFMKESDARTDKMMKLYEKYGGVEPEEQERLIAREMGWEQIEEYLNAKADGELPEKEEDPFDVEEFEMPEPDPLTEGIDWIRDERGHPKHPLCHRAFEVVTGMWHDCDDAGLMKKSGSKAVQDMVFSAQMVNAKLAGALNSLWMDSDRDGGFIVAYLKRALKYFNETMAHYQTVKKEGCVPDKRLERFHTDLCSIREEILRLMDKYRGKSL
ncbi:MAG: hypothetical protein WC047_06835 [Kiritimatiellales bacterium]